MTQPPGTADDDEPRTHTIVDGDSLPKLAERYLGDAKFSDQIYQLNRDVLNDPELLPIGAELKLPPRATAIAPIAPTSPPGLVIASPPPNLIPITEAVKASVDAPQARLLRPLPPLDATAPSTATSLSLAGDTH
jgi:hypothetical protein